MSRLDKAGLSHNKVVFLKPARMPFAYPSFFLTICVPALTGTISGKVRIRQDNRASLRSMPRIRPCLSAMAHTFVVADPRAT